MSVGIMVRGVEPTSVGWTPPHKKLLDEMNAEHPQLWGRLVACIVEDLEFQQFFGTETREVQSRWAERILDETLKFLLCTAHTKHSISPSAKVDIGWHTFILYTQAYAAFCQKFAGHFIHHKPNDVPGEDYSGADIQATVQELNAARFSIDQPLWQSGGRGKCYDTGDAGDTSTSGCGLANCGA